MGCVPWPLFHSHNNDEQSQMPECHMVLAHAVCPPSGKHMLFSLTSLSIHIPQSISDRPAHLCQVSLFRLFILLSFHRQCEMERLGVDQLGCASPISLLGL